MAESVVSFTVEAIGNLLIDEAKFLWGVEGKVKDLQEELKLIMGLLRDADRKREHNQSVGEWVAQLRDIAYDAEDVIERYILRVAPKKERNIIKACACFVAKCTCMQVHVVGTEIEDLKSRISSLGRQMQNYGLQFVNESKHVRARTSTPKRTYAHFVEEDFVGREDNIEELVKNLSKDGKQHRVISICGMGGLGKTTLAKKVFAHDEVKKNFDGFAWACVSQEHHVKDILVGILAKLDPDQREEIMKMRDDELFETLYKIQQEKRCIVVLDDIWTKQAWDGLRAAFPFEDTRSKLLVTTRNREIAEYIYPQGFFHEPKCLSDQESWELLTKRAFPETKDITENMKRLGDELLKKCGGLPLAVIVLGGLLAVNEWETVYKNINLHFGDKSDISKVLALSYDDLPRHLKPCFLYLGCFPEDAEIHAVEVLHMWIVEGFVLLDAYDEYREITVEDIAEQYLMELVNRGMVQARFKLSGKIKTCHLHDLMRELCISKATQESFLSIRNIRNIQLDNEMEDCSSSMATYKTRRLSLNVHGLAKGDIFLRVEQIERTMLHLRTLMLFYSRESVGRMWKQFRPICINNKFLKVLKLECVISEFGSLPKAVGDLVHLRFLSLAGSDFEGLPQSMGNLVCMEFLDLRGIQEVTVPNVLWKMRRLRHLCLPNQFAVEKKFREDRKKLRLDTFREDREKLRLDTFRGNRKKLRLDTLKNLHTLKNFHMNNCDVNDVAKLTSLRKLTLAAIKDADDKLEIIPQLAKFDLKHLQSSSFIFLCRGYESLYSKGLFREGELSKMSSYPHSCRMSLWGRIEKLPEHKNLPQQLRKLVLFCSHLKEDPMPILEKLQHLVVLMLGPSTFSGKEMVCSAGGFPRLRHLLLKGLPSLEEWRVAEGAMPHLSRLGISDCRRLKAVPQGVHVYNCHEAGIREMRRFTRGF